MVPSAAEKSVIMSRLRSRGKPRIGLKADCSDAHRTFKIAEEDHASQCCQLGNTVIVNRVGTQGVGSASYWFSRLYGLVGRLLYYIFIDEEFWVFTYADDQDFIAAGDRMVETVVLAQFFMTILKVPLSWKKM